MSGIEGITLPVPTGGYDTDTGIEDLGSLRAPRAHNVLLGRKGVLPMRGPITEQIEFDSTPAGCAIVGRMVYGDNVMIGRREPSATATRDPWVAHYRKAAASSELSLTASASRPARVNLIAKSASLWSVLVASSTPGPSSTRVGGKVYGIQYYNLTSVLYNGGYHWLTQLQRWDGTSAAPTAYTNAPRGAQAVKSHYTRLFVLGGRNPDGSGTLQPNSLWFSDPIAGSDLPDTVAAWQNDASGLVNQIQVDADDVNDFGVALAKVGDDLAIFKRQSIYVLRGYSPDTFVLRPFSKSVGCIDPRSVVEFDDGCYFMSEHGYMWFDGSQIVPVAEHLRSDQLALALEMVGDHGVDGGYCNAHHLGENYLMLNIGRNPLESVDVTEPLYSAMMYIPDGSWTTFSSGLLVGDMPIMGDRTLSREFLVDEGKVYLATTLTAPELEQDESKRGLDTDSDSGTTIPILAEVFWRVIGGGFPFYKQQLSRLFVDYNFQVSGAASDGDDDGWQLSLVDANGDALLTPFQVPAQADPANTAFPYRRRYGQDVHAEADEIQVRASIVDTGSNPGVAKADLQKAHLLFQRTRRRPSD